MKSLIGSTGLRCSLLSIMLAGSLLVAQEKKEVPKGAAPVSFRMTKSESGEVEFTNPSHDFPQRVRYVRTTTGLDAEVSLADGSKPVRWSYRRTGSPTGE